LKNYKKQITVLKKWAGHFTCKRGNNLKIFNQMFYGVGGGVGMTCDGFSKACPNLVHLLTTRAQPQAKQPNM